MDNQDQLKDALPSYTLDKIAKGEAILFLGAGASLSCVNASGVKALSTAGLRDALCDEFLGGKAKDRQLSSVGDLVKSVAGILELQRFVADRFAPLLPTAPHLSLPSFRWKAIITTNYDLTVEKAYDAAKTPMQSVRPIISDDDPISSIISSPEKNVPFLKIHGCVTRANDVSLPMILSSWEYSKFRHRRARLFTYLKDWGYEYPIIFCGYSIADENVRDILFELSDPNVSHPRYALISPSIIPEDQRMWAERKIDAVPTTFDGFMKYLDREIPRAKRSLGYVFKGVSGPISKHIPGGEVPSQELGVYLEKSLLLVDANMATEAVQAENFYRGMSDNWGWLVDGLDVKRSVVDEIILGSVIESEGKRVEPQLHLLLGYAGSGKSVALKRFAWEVSDKYSLPIFFLNPDSHLDSDLLFELYGLIRNTIYLVVDDVIAHVDQIVSLFRAAVKMKVPVVLIGGARTNEWNVDGADLVPFLTESHELLDLEDVEVKALVSNLRKHRCLGYMKDFNDHEAFSYLKSKLENQLLVALHEATSGASFASIIEDEYLSVVPTEAQKLYLDICTVHRVGVPVRAGTISRISGIRLEDFKEKLFRPLEHVVHAKYNPAIGDYVYKTRHPKIAEIVFDSAIRDEISRSDQMVRIIGSMNTGYVTDDEAITRLIKSKNIAKEYSDKELAYAIFRAARLSGISDEVVDQHLAHFEALHEKGNLKKALGIIEDAISEARNSKPAKSTLHVKALILRELAKSSSISGVERDKRRQEARAILDRLMSDKRDPHPFNAKANLLLDELDDRLDDERQQSDRVVADLIRDIQSALASSRQLFPRDAFTASVEARFATAMEQHPRATSILERAHKADPHTAFLAIRLAEKYRKEGATDKAIAVLSKTLKVGGPNKEVHLAMAEALISLGQKKNSQLISDHLKRSFAEGDSRLRARFLFARHEYLYGSRERAKKEFDLLARERMPPAVITQSRDAVLDEDGQPKRYFGEVIGTPKDTFCFAKCLELGGDVYVHRKEVLSNLWSSVSRGAKLEFSLTFNFQGAQAVNVKLVGR